MKCYRNITTTRRNILNFSISLVPTDGTFQTTTRRVARRFADTIEKVCKSVMQCGRSRLGRCGLACSILTPCCTAQIRVGYHSVSFEVWAICGNTLRSQLRTWLPNKLFYATAPTLAQSNLGSAMHSHCYYCFGSVYLHLLSVAIHVHLVRKCSQKTILVWAQNLLVYTLPEFQIWSLATALRLCRSHRRMQRHCRTPRWPALHQVRYYEWFYQHLLWGPTRVAPLQTLWTHPCALQTTSRFCTAPASTTWNH